MTFLRNILGLLCLAISFKGQSQLSFFLDAGASRSTILVKNPLFHEYPDAQSGSKTLNARFNTYSLDFGAQFEYNEFFIEGVVGFSSFHQWYSVEYNASHAPNTIEVSSRDQKELIFTCYPQLRFGRIKRLFDDKVTLTPSIGFGIAFPVGHHFISGSTYHKTNNQGWWPTTVVETYTNKDAEFTYDSPESRYQSFLGASLAVGYQPWNQINVAIKGNLNLAPFFASAGIRVRYTFAGAKGN